VEEWLINIIDELEVSSFEEMACKDLDGVAGGIHCLLQDS